MEWLSDKICLSQFTGESILLIIFFVAIKAFTSYKADQIRVTFGIYWGHNSKPIAPERIAHTQSDLNFGLSFGKLELNEWNINIAFPCFNEILRKTDWLNSLWFMWKRPFTQNATLCCYFLRVRLHRINTTIQKTDWFPSLVPKSLLIPHHSFCSLNSFVMMQQYSDGVLC